MRARHHIRYSVNAGRSHFGSAADRALELARLDDLIALCRPAPADQVILRIARKRRRKVSGWVVGA